jgi:hypothetical protein
MFAMNLRLIKRRIYIYRDKKIATMLKITVMDLLCKDDPTLRVKGEIVIVLLEEPKIVD